MLGSEERARLEDGKGGDRLSAERARSEKIARYRRQKALRAEVERLSSVRDDADTDATGYDDDGDGDARALAIARVNLASLDALDTLASIGMETELLRNAPPPPPQEQPKDAEDARVDSTPVPSTGPLLDGKGKPLRPFVITSERTKAQRQVFGPGYNLPTMSVDEYLEAEKRRGGILEPDTTPAPPREDPDDEAVVDRETYKAREWDEFAEANPKGSGNRMVNRG